MQNFILFEEYITLGQALKELGLIATGGQAKMFLASNDGEIFHNHEPENRRGKKMHDGDLLELPTYDLSVRFVAATAQQLADRNEEKAEEDRVKAIVKKMNAENKPKKAPKKAAPRFPGRS
ncbi:RNA-binding S4 domain-containing protein [Lactococcus fujiensis]|uniref:Uncharacterized protein n=1 Tax=Lactococcus fujiensis JCM 16395 TaxID=1291764 RepID=A0A2A5RN21_9LACT|nr:RNA-binding S4 domain-containing protein [Lactococcus fujiensis]PCS00736.1 hypothetical protein RT41_GL001118 [Lactococcus fujiensis JCM 16395]